MNREDIIRMAREAGLSDEVLVPWAFEIERFAQLVAAAEREACREIAGEYAQLFTSHPCVYVADAIRARGQQ